MCVPQLRNIRETSSTMYSIVGILSTIVPKVKRENSGCVRHRVIFDDDDDGDEHQRERVVAINKFTFQVFSPSKSTRIVSVVVLRVPKYRKLVRI